MDPKFLAEKGVALFAAIRKHPELFQLMIAAFRAALDEYENGHGSMGKLRTLLDSVCNTEFGSDEETLKMATGAGAAIAAISKFLKDGANHG